jgi:hypothetical protein
MKQLHTFLFIAILLSATTSHSQIQKGATFLGGDLSLGTQWIKNENPDSKYSSDAITVVPVFGKAIRENVILGGDLRYSHGKVESHTSPGSEETGNAYGAGVFVRKYYFLGKSGFSVFAQGRFGFLYSKTEYNNGTSIADSKTYNYSINAYPGISYSISRKFQLETGVGNFLSLSYQSNRTTSPGTIAVSKSRSLQLSTSLFNQTNFYVGFRILLNNTAKG